MATFPLDGGPSSPRGRTELAASEVLTATRWPTHAFATDITVLDRLNATDFSLLSKTLSSLSP